MILTLPGTLKAKVGLLLFITVVCATGLSSCKKKDSDAATLSIEGSWRAVDSSSTAYVIFSKGTATYLQRGSYNIHDVAKSAYAADNETVTFSLSGSPQLFNYKVSNDTLYITNTNSYLRFIKDNTVNPDTWVKYFTTVQTSQLPSGLWFGSTEWTGTDFLISSTYANKLYRASAVSSAVTDSTAIALNATGLAITANGEIWVNNYGADNKLYKVNPATGAVISSSSPAPGMPTYLGADGNIIWFFSANGLYTYNTATDVFTLKSPVSSFLGTPSSVINADMVIKDGYAYLCVYGYILKYNLTTYQVEETYKGTDSSFNVGIAYDGSNFWVLNFSGGSSLATLVIKLNKIQF